MKPSQTSYKSQGGVGRLSNALRYSAQGLSAAIRHEAAFRQELLVVALLTPVAIWLGRSIGEVVLLICPLLFVLIIELVNSAIEALADTITLDHHPMIARAKDLGSAAVFLSITFAALIWIAVIVSQILV